MASDFVIPLNTPNTTLDTVGGKGMSLANMASAGFAVPDGFCLTTAAYKQFVDENDLQAQIVALATPAIVDGVVSFEAASIAIRALFDAPIPEDIVTGATAAFAGLNDKQGLAVRSSATAEDLPGLSFAGQQDTYLNVRGGDAFIAAVKNCWASLWTERAIGYRHENDVPQGDVAMAVVVQQMVASDVSGTLFTANPATGERGDMIINASFGLGEAVVGGEVTPDTCVVDKDNLAVRETIIGSKAIEIVGIESGGTETRDLSEGQRDSSSLSETQLSELAATAKHVEALYDGVPQDIEWAFRDDTLHLLQSRPITRLPAQPIDVSWVVEDPNIIYIRRQIVELMLDPLSTLFEDTYLKSLGSLDFKTLNGYAYSYRRWDFDGPQDRGIPRGNEGQTDEREMEVKAHAKRDAALFAESLDEEDLAALTAVAQQYDADVWPQKLTYAERDEGVPWAYNLNTQTRDKRARNLHETAIPGFRATVDQWRGVDPASATDDQLLTGMCELVDKETWYWCVLPRQAIAAHACARHADQFLQEFLAEHAPGFSSGQFLSGMKSRTMQAARDLATIACMIRDNTPIYELVVTAPRARLMSALRAHPDAGAILEAIDRYLEVNGHQVYALDFAEPTLAEDPTEMVVTLKTMLANPDHEPAQHEALAKRKRDQAYEDIKQVLDGAAYWQFRFRVWFARRYYELREESTFHLSFSWPVFRSLAAELGRRLVAVGTLASADDIYHLKTAEIEQAIAARADDKAVPAFSSLAAERRELRTARKQLRAPNMLPEKARKTPNRRINPTFKANDPDVPSMSGFGVSPGTVTGRASLVESAEDFNKMQQGTILVCHTTSPAWTHLFPQAIGLVTNIGSITAHDALVAREYGIPAVLGIGEATDRIAHGQMISVDGDRGVVALLDE